MIEAIDNSKVTFLSASECVDSIERRARELAGGKK
jgi:hypothetical protein